MGRSAYAPAPRRSEITFPVAFDPTIHKVVSEEAAEPDDADGSPPERRPLVVYLEPYHPVAEGGDLMGSVGDRHVKVGRADVVASGDNCGNCFAHTSVCTLCGGHVTNKEDEE